MIKVSVVMITYNHFDYIKEAVLGVFNQETDFDIEVIIADDNSPDETESIIRELMLIEPNHVKLRYTKHVNNKGPQINFVWAVDQCSGEYIALCEGDDYWTDSGKLQKQVDFLDANLDCVSCHHWQKDLVKDYQGRFVEQESGREGYYPLSITGVQTIFDNKMRIKTRTHVFRNVVAEYGFQFPNWFFEVAYGDVPLSMLLGQYGSFGFIDQEMAVYRRTETGMSSWAKREKNYRYRHNKNWLFIWQKANRYYANKYFNSAVIADFYKQMFLSDNRVSFFYKMLFELLFAYENNAISHLRVINELKVFLLKRKVFCVKWWLKNKVFG